MSKLIGLLLASVLGVAFGLLVWAALALNEAHSQDQRSQREQRILLMPAELPRAVELGQMMAAERRDQAEGIRSEVERIRADIVQRGLGVAETRRRNQ